MKALRRRLVRIGFVCMAPVFLALSGQPPVGVHKRVLALHFARPESGAFAGIDAALRKVLTDGLGDSLQYTSEYLDLIRFADPDFRSAMRAYLKARYADERFDAIIAASPAVFEFLEEDPSLFGDSPLVFMTRPGVTPASSATGVVSGIDFKGSLAAALRLRPDTANVYVVSGTSAFDTQYERVFRADVGTPPGAVTMTYLSGLELADLEQRVSRLPARSIIYYISVSSDRTGDRFLPLDVAARLSSVANAPVFGWHEGMLGHGIVGGWLHSSIRDAEEAGRLTLRVLKGDDPEAIPISHIDAHVSQFDARQLRRWQIAESMLPVGSVVLFRQPTFWQQSRGYVIGGAIVMSAQLALIVGLVAQRVRRRRAEQLYRSVVDAQSELICRFLPDTTLTFVNDAYCRFCNRPRDELIGRRFVELIPEEARQTVLDRVERLKQGTDSLEHQVMLPDGSVGWHHWINYAIADERGTVLELQGVGRDVTDRKRAEEAFKESEERNTAMLRAVPDLMFVILRDGTYLDYHARDPQLLFAPPATFIGKKVRDIMPPDLAERFMGAIEQAFMTDETVIVEYELQMDETRYYEGRIVHAGADRVLTMVRDVTDARRAQERSRDLAGRLIASQEVERHRIARELHDDLSQKVALLTIKIESLTNGNGAAREKLRELTEQAREIGTDIHNLSHELHPSKLQSLGLLVAMQSLCRDMSGQGSVRVSFTHGAVPPNVDPAVSLCLYRIAQEALHNVVRHSRARDAHVELMFDAGCLMLKIADSGVGFDEQAQHAGLGLVSMRERASLLKGQVAIHTSPGGGTRIGVRVPLAEPAPDASAPACPA